MLTATAAVAQNPIIDQGSADPSVRVFGGRAYVYGSHDFSPSNTTWVMKDWKVFSSADLVTWTDHGVVLADDAISWRGVTDRDFAPDATFFNNQYYFYFPLGDGTIGVASGDSPAGPFADILGQPLVARSTTPAFNIDPSAFQDTDGKRYLIWGNTSCYVAELNDDMKSFQSSPQKVTISGAPAYMEGPFAWMYGGKYYLLYSRCGSTCNDSLDYGIATSIRGPYTYKGTIIAHGKKGNEHGSVFQFNSQWYVAYHDLYPTDKFRKSRLEVIHYNNSGDIPRVYPTDYGVGRYDGSTQIEAENYFDKSTNISYEDCTDAGGGFNVTTIENDSWLKFPKVDLGAGATSIQGRVAASSGANRIEIWLGSSTGTLVATLDVPASDQTWTTLSADLSDTIAGVNDVFLVFKGEAGNLFKLNWIRFVVPGGPDKGGATNRDGDANAGGESFATNTPGCSCGIGEPSRHRPTGVLLWILGTAGLALARRRFRGSEAAVSASAPD